MEAGRVAESYINEGGRVVNTYHLTYFSAQDRECVPLDRTSHATFASMLDCLQPRIRLVGGAVQH